MNNPNNRNNKPNFTNFIPYLIVAVFLGLMLFTNPSSTITNKNIDYVKLDELLQSDVKINDAKISVDNNTITVSGTYTEKNTDYGFSAVVPKTENNIDNITEQLNYLKSEVQEIILLLKDAN